MTQLRKYETPAQRKAALLVCLSVPRACVRETLEMLGLLDLDQPPKRGSAWFDQGFKGYRDGAG